MQFPDEIQGQSRTVDWISLLCIQNWCLWRFVDGTNVACLFDLRVCYVYVLCYVRFAEEVTEVTINVRNDIQVSLRKRTLDIVIVDDMERKEIKKRRTLPWCL